MRSRMDLEMPIMNGSICTSTIRQLEADGSLSNRVPIIAITANAREEQLNKAMGVGMVSDIYCLCLLPLHLIVPIVSLFHTIFAMSLRHLIESELCDRMM
jgi:CheY-like chemotaxis protein